jgi:hypothetical protein
MKIRSDVFSLLYAGGGWSEMNEANRRIFEICDASK